MDDIFIDIPEIRARIGTTANGKCLKELHIKMLEPDKSLDLNKIDELKDVTKLQRRKPTGLPVG